MQTIGLIGGMSWESSAQYYRLINQGVQARLGGVHSARSLFYSVDFGEIERLQHAGDWDALGVRMIDAAQRLERGGADFIVLCTNTMHKVAPAIEAAVAGAIAESGAASIKDMGKVMAVLRAKHAAALDMAKAGPIVKARLSA